MQQIELQNSQNVSIQFETATFRQRVGAFFVDLVIIAALFLLLLVIFMVLMDGLISEDSSIKLALAIVGFYSLVNEYFFNGTSPGKRAFNLKVVSLSGESLFFSQLFARWACRFIDIWLSLGTVGMVFISGNQSGQRLGDLFAGTAVVKTRNTMLFRLNSLQSLPNRSNYQCTYPDVVRLKEEDVLLIKKLLDRYALSGKNEIHRNMIFTVVNNICRKLEIQRPDMDGSKFLKEVIKDYIILTR